MQAGAGDGRASQRHRLEYGDWGHCAGASDLEVNIEECSTGLVGGEFIGHGRARALGGVAQALLLVEAVDFDDDAIDLVGQFFAGGGVAVVEGEDFPDGGTALGGRIDHQAPFAQRVEPLGVALRAVVVAVRPVGEVAEIARGDEVGVLQFE